VFDLWEAIERDSLSRCDECGQTLHEPCAQYEQRYECPTCADERWIGTLEF
jgi:hypothetical protein